MAYPEACGLMAGTERNDMTTTTEPYLETFGCRLETEDDHDHPGDCEWGFACNLCGRWLDGQPCPDHAPRDIPGLMLADCSAVPPHPRTWLLADNTGYGAPCMYCAYDAEAKAHAPCEHSHHGPWRRWKVTRKALYWLAMAGLGAGETTSWGPFCRGCVHGFRWHFSGYVLGWPAWKWACVFKGRHWPGAEILNGICGKCSPCPGCGSTDLGHRAKCPVAS